MSRGLALPALLLGFAVVPMGASAQSLRAGIGAFMGFPSVERQAADTTSGSGTLIGVEAMAGIGPVEVTGRYAQGAVTGDAADDGRDLVEGEVILRFRPVSMFWLGAGPYARSYVFEIGTERWLTWEARVGFESPLGTDMLRGHLHVAYALGGSAEPGGSLQGARRVEGGIGFRLPRTPVEVGIAYRIEQADIEGDLARDIVEQVILRAKIGR